MMLGPQIATRSDCRFRPMRVLATIEADILDSHTARLSNRTARHQMAITTELRQKCSREPESQRHPARRRAAPAAALRQLPAPLGRRSGNRRAHTDPLRARAAERARDRLGRASRPVRIAQGAGGHTGGGDHRNTLGLRLGRRARRLFAPSLHPPPHAVSRCRGGEAHAILVRLQRRLPEGRRWPPDQHAHRRAARRTPAREGSGQSHLGQARAPAMTGIRRGGPLSDTVVT